MTNNNIEQKNKKRQSDFIDIERLIPRILNAWPLYIISMLIALSVALYLNNWKLNKIYSANTTFKIKENSGDNNNLASNSIKKEFSKSIPLCLKTSKTLLLLIGFSFKP